MKNEKLGYVGEITNINIQCVNDLLDNGYIPVISTVGCDDEGNVYNINGDTAAARIAGALNAERLIMMTDIAGILKDKDDPSTLIPETFLFSSLLAILVNSNAFLRSSICSSFICHSPFYIKYRK